jgi:hypothetical protein
VGSEVAVEAALDAMAGTDRAPLPTADTVQEAVKAARAAVLERASEREQDPAELASTLLLVLGDAERVAYAQVGDGAMVGRRMDELFFLAPLEDTEYSNVTVPLTSSRWRESLRVGEHPAVDAVSVMTDGCERSVLDTSEDGKSIHRPFFDPLFAFVEDLKDPAQGSLDLEQLLRSETFREHSGDDKTLVAATLTV